MMKKFSFIIMLFWVSAFLIFLLGIVLIQHDQSARILHQFLATHTIEFALWRYGISAVFIGLWPQFIRFLGKQAKWPKSLVQKLSNRIYPFIFLLMFELLIYLTTKV